MRYQINHALVQFASTVILEDVNFEVHDHEKIAVVGRNGCGKTTLLKLIAGDIEMNNLDSDETCGIITAGHQEIGFLRQINFEDGEISVENEIKKVFQPVFDCEKRMKELEESFTEEASRKQMGEYDFLQKKMEALRGYTWRTDMEIMFQSFGFPLSDLQRPIGTFSGGQQTKISFIKLLLSRPDIMLLDEPTNHLDLKTIEWLENYLSTYDKAVILVSHDRMFLDRVTDVTYEIEYKKIKRYNGNYSAFLKQKEENFLKQQKDYEEQQKEIERLTEWIEKWKNTPTKVAATRSKRMQIEHMVKIEKPRRFDTRAFNAMFQPRTESYNEVLNVKKLQIGYDHPLSEVSFRLMKGERLAVIGENGKGKSTLLKTLVELIPALDGTFHVGSNVEIGYFDQQEAVQSVSDPEKTVLMDFWDTYPNLLREEVRSALGAFLFSGDDVEKKMGMLSGGEKVRLALCKMFYTRPNFLILDEPTNHMDMEGKEALEKMLLDYQGTVLFVSHDRYFIRQIATGILDFTNEEVRQYDLNYDLYLDEKRRREQGIIKDFVKTSGVMLNQDIKVEKEKKVVVNPGKEKSRLQKRLEKCEEKLMQSEEKAEKLRLELENPALSSDFTKLMELQGALDEEESLQEELLLEMMEIEENLKEYET